MKISKKDQDPKQVEKDAAALEEFLKKRCQHFEPGTYVVMNRRRGLVVRHTTNRDNSGIVLLRIKWEDGSLEAVASYALNR